jgi:hypothetical protein
MLSNKQKNLIENIIVTLAIFSFFIGWGIAFLIEKIYGLRS